MASPVLPMAEPTGQDAILASLPAPFSIERDERKTSAADEGDSPLSLNDALGMQPELPPEAKKAMAALYTETFPLLSDDPQDDDWSSWADALWTRHSAALQRRLHIVERNRLFRRGVQWISSVGLGPWREPPKPRDAARVVANMVGPALDQRVQLISEQRPGFKTRPQSLDPMKVKRAEAQQIALEYQYDQQQMTKIIREMAYWAGTDGISFCELSWDTNRGPWDDYLSTGQQMPVGDIKPTVRRIEQVRVSANATYTEDPWYWVIREVIDEAQAIRQYGLKAVDTSNEVDPSVVPDQATRIKHGYMLPELNEHQRDQRTMERTIIYCERSEYLPQGLTLIVVGKSVVFLGPLALGCPPIFYMRDGSTDPSFYPAAIMETWIDPQMRINAVLSKWVENVRLNAGPKLIAKQHAIVGETLTAGTMSTIEIKGLGDINSTVRPLEAFSLAPDAINLLEREKKAFEDLSGWNDVSRGQFSADTSGRAILAIREQLERVFAPPVNAAAEGMMKWAKISLGYMKWGYDSPRTIALQGAGRPDLATVVQQDDFDGVVDVWIDPETLMPMPRALRMFLLDDMFQKGLIDAREYRQRQQFAWTRNLSYADEIHEARARRVCEAIRSSGQAMALPILWQDNEAIHQDVLEKELILPDDTDQVIRGAAFERWMMLAQQAAMKGLGPMPPTGMGGPPQGAGTQPGQQPGMPATQQPFQGTNPGVAASNAGAMSGPDENRAARAFDQMPH